MSTIHGGLGISDERMHSLFMQTQAMAEDLNDYCKVLLAIATMDILDIERMYMSFVLGSYMGVAKAREAQKDMKKKPERSLTHAITNIPSRSHH